MKCPHCGGVVKPWVPKFHFIKSKDHHISMCARAKWVPDIEEWTAPVTTELEKVSCGTCKRGIDAELRWEEKQKLKKSCVPKRAGASRTPLDSDNE